VVSSGLRVAGAALAITALVAFIAVGGAGARSRPGPRVVSASLTQEGQQLVWRVEFSRPIRLRDAHACLRIEPRRGAPVRVCIATTRRGRGMLAASDAARPVPAAIAPAGSAGLTATFTPGEVGLGYRALRWQVIKPSRYPARAELIRLHAPKLIGCVASGPSLVYQGSSGKREIALTFDDGPWDEPPTSAFLRVLEREHVVATFFEIGDQISKYDPDGAFERRMLADGDMIGDHTWSHPMMTALTPRKQRAQLLETVDSIRHSTHGFTPCLWRPPYGAINPRLVALAHSLGLLTIMWDVDPRDWALPGANAIYANVISHAHDGAIVIQHFGGGPRYQTLAALPREIETLRRQGYTFVTVAQLLGLRLIYS
jgi:peptidoglycan-N-acetylglucosamine deacetylase